MMQSLNALQGAVLARIDSISDQLIDLARRIHAHPEVAFQEVRSSQWLVETLQRHGFDTSPGIADLPTAFRAEFNGNGDGKAAHAASAPDEGINALDALIQMFVNIGLLRQQLRDDVRIHGIITYGGAAVNIIPDRAEAKFSVRAADRGTASLALERVVKCGRAAAEATGATLEYTMEKGYDAMRSNAPLAEAFGCHLTELDWPVDPRPEKPRMGSTDMGDVSQAIPAIHPYVKIVDNAAGHTVEFREAALSDRAMDAMLVAAKAMALTGLDYLRDPEFRETIDSSFRQ